METQEGEEARPGERSSVDVAAAVATTPSSVHEAGEDDQPVSFTKPPQQENKTAKTGGRPPDNAYSDSVESLSQGTKRTIDQEIASVSVDTSDASTIQSNITKSSAESSSHQNQHAPHSSLEDLQSWPFPRTGQRFGDVRASQISLPSSQSFTSLSSESMDRRAFKPQDSLRNLRLQPENVPLPSDGEEGLSLDSDSSSDATTPKFRGFPKPKRKKRPSTKVESATPTPSLALSLGDDVEIYRGNVARLAAHFPGFENVAASDTRHIWSSRIVLHDKLEGPDGGTRRLEPWSDVFTSPPEYEEFFRVIRDVPENCRQRIILVEDLSPSLVGLLGATFQIPPHVFKEHLEGSGYRRATENHEESKAWQTRSSAQGYASITWYRPVLPLVPMNAKLRARLLLNTRPAIQCIFEGCKMRHNVRLGTMANIWRRNLRLCSEPGDYHKGSKMEFPVGWEERATIFTKDIDRCKFVILLLDPLPVTVISGDDIKVNIEQSQRRRVPVLASLLLPSERLVEVQAALDSRPADQAQSQFVRDWVGPLRQSDLESQSTTMTSRTSRDSGPASTRPRTSMTQGPSVSAKLTTKNLARATGVGLSMPDPDEQNFSPAALRRRATKADMDTKTLKVTKIGGRSVITKGGIRTPDKGQPIDPYQNRAQEEAQATPSHEPFVPYNPIKARPSASAKIGNSFTTLDVHAYIESLQVPSSTLDEFEYFLHPLGKGKEASVYDPFRALFRIIHDDTNSLVDIIRISCQQIREGTMDEDLMQKRVSFWRSLTRQLNFTLAEMEQQLRVFVNFTYDSETAILAHDRRIEMPSERLAKDTRLMLNSCITLLDRTSSSLLSEMQIVDSRRSIAEAESVSKLTELAFVFIPLSFVASLFSMQIHELQDGTSAYVFVLVAIGFVVIAYAVRLSIRSSRIVAYKTHVLNQVRDESHIPYNQPIPTHTFLVWAGGVMGGNLFKAVQSFFYFFTPIAVVGAIIAAILSPIILLWLRNMNRSFTAVVTVLLLFLDGVLVYPVVTNAAGVVEFNPRKIIREITQVYEYNKKIREKKKRRQKKKADNPYAIDVDSSDDD